jgi:hypothetical protein
MSLELEREEVIQRLCRDFANDRMTTQELETKLEAAQRARTADDLRALVADSAPLAPISTPAPMAGTRPRDPAEFALREPLRISAMFASARKQGDWEPAPVTHASATFGEIILDFREARIGPGVTVVHASATFGSIEIIVPPGVHVECDGSATFGEFSERVSMTAPVGAVAPTLRITGEALFAEVTVVMRFPGESAGEAKRREREARRLEKEYRTGRLSR